MQHGFFHDAGAPSLLPSSRLLGKWFYRPFHFVFNNHGIDQFEGCLLVFNSELFHRPKAFKKPEIMQGARL